MTYRCFAKKGVYEIQVVGYNALEAARFENIYIKDGYEVQTIEDKFTKTYTESQVKEMLLSFYNEHISTTIEIGEKEVDNWMERRNK